MPSINSVTLLGHLGRDPEIKYTNSGQTVCNASIATEKRWKPKDGGDWKKNTTWHKIVAWGKLAEVLGATSKGNLILVQGELTNRSWENKEGVKQYVTEILARLVVLAKEPAKPTEGEGAGEIPPGPDDDVPF